MAQITPALNRRMLLAAALAAPVPAWAAGDGIVTMLGDSLTAGQGLPPAAALPAQLRLALARLGVKAEVRDAGVSGDTTADGLARIDADVGSDTDVCVVALGGNDMLQRIDPAVVRANLEKIVVGLQARRIGVVLAGLSAPLELGVAYARDFEAVFPSLSRAYRIALCRNLLDGVEGVPALNQSDGIHPNAQGVKIVADHLAPVVARALHGRG